MNESLTRKANEGCYETIKDYIFSGCFDLVCISVFFEAANEDGEIYYTDYIRIATTKQTSRHVSQMLDEIESSLPNFLDICFSKSLKKAGLIKNKIRSIWNTRKILDETIHVYESTYGYFCNQKKTTVEYVDSIVNIKDMRKVNQSSLRWLTSHIFP